MPREVLGGDTLRLQSSSESDAREADTEPVEHSRNGAHVGEPTENGVRRLGDGHVGQSREKGAKSHCVDGGSHGVCTDEDLWGLAGLGKTVQGTGGGVQIGRAGRPGRG